MGDETDVSAVPVHALQVINKVDKAVAHLWAIEFCSDGMVLAHTLRACKKRLPAGVCGEARPKLSSAVAKFEKH
jgi:hypothetical protein